MAISRRTNSLVSEADGVLREAAKAAEAAGPLALRLRTAARLCSASIARITATTCSQLNS